MKQATHTRQEAMRRVKENLNHRGKEATNKLWFSEPLIINDALSERTEVFITMSSKPLPIFKLLSMIRTKK